LFSTILFGSGWRSCNRCPSDLDCSNGVAEISDQNIVVNISINGDLFISSSQVNVTSLSIIDLTLIESYLYLKNGSVLTITQNLISQQSIIELKPNSTTVILGNSQLFNSDIKISPSSQLSFLECVDFINSKLLINEEVDQKHSVEIILGSQCPDISLDNIQFIPNEDNCADTTLSTDRQYETRFIIYIDKECTGTNPFPDWLIGIICVVVLFFIVLAVGFVILVTMSLRRKYHQSRNSRIISSFTSDDKEKPTRRNTSSFKDEPLRLFGPVSSE